MDYSRIEDVIDVKEIQQKRIAIFGAGGSAGLARNIIRCGGNDVLLFDFDPINAVNITRQDHDATDIGRFKVDALADAIHRINPDTKVNVIKDNFLNTDPHILDAILAGCNLLIFATDSFAAQAGGNELALRLNVPALWIGLYPGGTAGEIIFWHPGIDACYRCLCPSRYEAQAIAKKENRSLDPSSNGATIFDVTLLDSIAGMLAIGLLTMGSDNRFGRLIERLGDRNFIQVQLDQSWNFSGMNPVRKYLGVAEDCQAFFAWNTIVRADPDGGTLSCPDCAKYRNHIFTQMHGVNVRLKTPQSPSGMTEKQEK